MRPILIALTLLCFPFATDADKPPAGASCEWHRDNCRRCCRVMWGECTPFDGHGGATDPHGYCPRCVGDCLPRQCGGKGEYANCRCPARGCQ